MIIEYDMIMPINPIKRMKAIRWFDKMIKVRISDKSIVKPFEKLNVGKNGLV